MADCIECLAPLADGEWSVHANRGKCMANLQAAARAMSLRIADLEAKLALHADASRRASALWREAHPDAPTYPDGVDLMVWLMGQLADAEAMRRETVALCERVEEARPLGGDVVAVLDAIRAVTDGDIALRSPGSSSADGWERAMSSAPGLRELFLAAATAAAGGAEATEECGSCRGHGRFSSWGKPTRDQSARKCLDCDGSGRVPV